MSQNNIKVRLLEHYFINPTSKLRVRQIERELNIPLPSAIRYARDLEKAGLLTREKIGNVVFYTANRDHAFILEKKLYNIKSLYACGLVDYLREELSNPSIIVFGSYSKGEDTEQSDIDMYIQSPSKKTISLEKYEKILKRNIQAFRHKSIHDIQNIHLANNIINGVILNGFIEAFR
jgi:predicted nucleotidyltransferase